MTIGERIKKIRVFRKMTMDDLGGALGFEGKNMSVRISQYETGARIPGEDMILKLADALHCNYKAISDYSLGAAEDIIETLFWLEESAASLPARGKGTRFPEYTAPGNLIHLTAMTPAKLHIAKLNGRLCGAKRPHSVSEQPNFYQSLQSNPYNDSSHPSGGE